MNHKETQRLEEKSKVERLKRDFFETIDMEGHDPDLDENGICKVCGKYEPE